MSLTDLAIELAPDEGGEQALIDLTEQIIAEEREHQPGYASASGPGPDEDQAHQEYLAAREQAAARLVLRGLRARHGWTQPRMADLLGVGTESVCRWETGARPMTPRTIRSLVMLAAMHQRAA